MEYIIEKSPIPIIFIDTFAIIDFYKHSKGNVRNKYIGELYELLKTLVNNKKVICPIAYQEYEINESALQAMSHFASLSLGIRFKDNFEIKLHQMYQSYFNMKNNNDIFLVSYNDAFNDDLIKQINKVKDIIITVMYEQGIEEINEKEIVKRKNMDELNEFKKSKYNKKNYEDQLKHEFSESYQAAKVAFDILFYKIQLGEPISLNDYNVYADLFSRPFLGFQSVLGEEKTIFDFFEYLKSNYHNSIPYVDIHVRMLADMIVSNKDLDTGDTQDATNAAALLPYCHLFITDRRQRNRIRRLGLDEKYNTKVFSFTENDILELIIILKDEYK